MLKYDLLVPQQMVNFHQSLPCKIDLLIIKLQKAPHHPVPKSYGHPKSMIKLTLNKTAIQMSVHPSVGVSRLAFIVVSKYKG